MRNKSTIFWTSVGIIMLLGFIRLYGFLHKTIFYWTFHNLATRSLKDASIVGLFITLAIPLITGIILVIVAKRPLIGVATASGFLATLLQSWPILFFTNLRPYLVPLWLKGHPFKIFILQCLYIASYTILCRLGALIASRKYSKSVEYFQETKKDSAMQTILLGIVVCIIWQVLSSLWR